LRWSTLRDTSGQHQQQIDRLGGRAFVPPRTA
jgi:hypothetical protein